VHKVVVLPRVAGRRHIDAENAPGALYDRDKLRVVRLPGWWQGPRSTA
jgi:hypothetical protein